LPHASHPRRIAFVTAAAVAGFAVAAPQWVSATPAEPAPPAVSAPASADALTGPALPDVAAPIAIAAPATPVVIDVPEPAAVPATPPAVVDELPVVVPPSPIVPAPPAAVPADQPAAPEARTTGSITVHVGTVDGATRSVSLQTPEGDPVGDRATVTGAPISFDDLAPGTYELFVEQVADGGGTFLTRTVLTVAAGEDRAVSCHGESLECS
jgi:hypothetical protein